MLQEYNYEVHSGMYVTVPPAVERARPVQAVHGPPAAQELDESSGICKLLERMNGLCVSNLP